MRQFVVFCILLSLIPLPASANIEQIYPKITEVMTGTEDKASAEFIELFNPGDEPFELANYFMQYKSATGENWLTKYEFEDEAVIEPRGYALLVTEEFVDEHDHEFHVFNSGLSKAAGHVRLVQIEEVDAVTQEVELIEEETEIDKIGWGESADSPETTFVVAPEPGDSIKRITNEDGEYEDTDDNSQDLFISEQPHPQHTLPPQELDSEEPPENEASEEETNSEEDFSEEGTQPVTYMKLEISELFIDPKSPQSDGEDEFVELYNPNSEKVNLEGYTLQTGSSLQYSHTFEADSVPAKSYKAFKIKQTGTILANSGGRAQLLDPNDGVAAELVSYEAAKSGESWALFDDGFAWTNVVTPSGENQRSKIEPDVKTAVTAGATKVSTNSNKTYPRILITEALPDPLKPKLDKTDEFVELYNPNTFPVTLTGYKLKTGKSLSSNQTLEEIIILPGQYVALFSSENRMTLGNNGGQIQLQDPNGKVLSSADEYSEAPEGASWANIDNKWQWTSKPTPAAKNVSASIEAPGGGSSSSATTSENGQLEPQVLSSLSQTAAIPVRPTDYKLVGGAIVVAVLYGLYEFRHDIRLRIHQSRSYLGAWREARK